MRATRLWPAILLAAGGGLILGCGDRSPIGVPSQAPAPQSSLIGGLPGAAGLLRCQPLPYDSSTETIGPDGGTIQVGPHSLVIPAGALAAPTVITAVVVSGPVTAVRFEPQGLQFEQTAAFLQEARARERPACLPEAIACYEAAVAAAERGGERAVLSEALRRLAVMRRHRSEAAAARALCHRSYDVARQAGNDLLAAE